MWDKRILLEQLKTIGPGNAEYDTRDPKSFFRNFLVVDDYRNVLDPDILLILGGRGVGKSALFHVLNLPGGPSSILQTLRHPVSIAWDRACWIRGYGRVDQDRFFPAPDVLQSEVDESDALWWRAFWIGLLLACLLRDGTHEVKEVLRHRISDVWRAGLERNRSHVSEWFPQIRENMELANDILDELDEYLTETNQWLFVTYDELDRLVKDYHSLFSPIRELLAFWLDRWRRWRRIRPKIFLRSDLFSMDKLRFPDASKYSGHQVSLNWTPNELYQLLIKRLANLEPPMHDYVVRIPDIIEGEDEQLGYLPTHHEHLHKAFIDEMVGPFMGANARKGITFRWIPNHLMDAEGQIAPRPFIKLFAFAAERELESFDVKALPGDRLLRPINIQGALMQTSQERIAELLEEYPWVSALASAFQNVEVPAPEERFIDALQRAQWSETEPPPSREPRGVIEALIQLGILERRLDGRLNAPEIYMHGFGMKRRGGVKRPRA
ncbi:P-loop ATPase, Sll1717 family [Alicyclobacillus sendaiensis]|uniref:P-loop ATPase, Sll1717 family n=1 Tax=Alicyclobacillus sendaiensis TaxID=192387 RepID=UPI000781EFDF|nr:hypothetical protein [Alicyclobacillus sendaiensis]